MFAVLCKSDFFEHFFRKFLIVANKRIQEVYFSVLLYIPLFPGW